MHRGHMCCNSLSLLTMLIMTSAVMSCCHNCAAPTPVAAPVQVIRVSPHVYNTEAEIEQLIAAVAGV